MCSSVIIVRATCVPWCYRGQRTAGKSCQSQQQSECLCGSRAPRAAAPRDGRTRGTDTGTYIAYILIINTDLLTALWRRSIGMLRAAGRCYELTNALHSAVRDRDTLERVRFMRCIQWVVSVLLCIRRFAEFCVLQESESANAELTSLRSQVRQSISLFVCCCSFVALSLNSPVPLPFLSLSDLVFGTRSLKRTRRTMQRPRLKLFDTNCATVLCVQMPRIGVC